MIQLSRHSFLTGFASSVLFAGAVSRAGTTDSLPTGQPNLKFGVISDVHLNHPGDEDTFLAALTYFRDRGADAVMIAGDIADTGRTDQLVRCGDCWRKIFPGNKAPDGRPVEKLFIYGNHDVNRKGDICKDFAGAWRKAFDEPYAPIWMKTVKGYAFVGVHWSAHGGIAEFLAAHAADLKGAKPFFYTQHPHPRNTCIGRWSWGQDSGASTKALSRFPNAVAFSGHSHYTLTDERSLWQGSFTSINTASLRYMDIEYSLRENARANSQSYRGEARKHTLPAINTRDGRQGMLVSVYGNTLVIERRDFVRGAALGPNWIVPIPGGKDRTTAARAAQRSAPAFAPDVKVAVAQTPEAVTLSFPAAKSVAACRPFEYEVTATLVEDGVDLILAQRRMMAPDFYQPETPAGAPGTFIFRRSELAWSGHYVFTIRPIECFGKKGVPIVSPVTLLAKYTPPKPVGA